MASAEEPDSKAQDQPLALGGVFTRQAGCLLIPFLPIRAAGALVITARRVVFDPILHYKLLAKKREIPIEEIARVESSGENVGLSVLELVSFGKNLRIFLKSGATLTYRSTQADELSAVINALVEGRPVAVEQEHADQNLDGNKEGASGTDT